MEDHLRFVQYDVRNLGQHAEFDITFCCRLRYHLDAPIAFLQQIGESTRRLLILNTHFAENGRNPRFRRLGMLTEHEGVRGRWFREMRRSGWARVADRIVGRWYRRPPQARWESVEAMEGEAWASWQNTASFWPLKLHLLDAMKVQGGFAIVSEQYDALKNIMADPYAGRYSRGTFVGMKYAG